MLYSPLIIPVLIFIVVIICFLLYTKTRSKDSIYLKILIITMALVSVGVILSCYPFLKYRHAIESVSTPFDSGEYALASRKSQAYLNDYSDLEQVLLGTFIGHTPTTFFLKTIGICEYKQKNYTEAIEAFNKLVKYAKKSPYPQDQENVTFGEKILRKIGNQIDGGRLD